MEKENCSNCVYCKFLGLDRDDIEVYQCENKESKKYGMILDRFTVDIRTCKEHKFDPELTA